MTILLGSSIFLLCLHVSLLFLLMNSISSELLVEFGVTVSSATPLSFNFLFDNYSVLFLSFIFLISSVVLFYSIFYMSGDPTLFRFLVLVLSFVFSMLFLVASPSLLSIVLGWDGLGITSFLLVIYYNNISACRSGLLTIFTNRLGDVFLIMGFSVFFCFGWCGLDYLFIEFSLLMVLILLAGMTKSAQLPFCSWLPAAMAAPTPVSSLVHSSTLVTAGVYLFIRFYFLFDSCSHMFFFSLLFLMTSFSAGLFACYEVDLKKLVAMSTLSQLGLMMFSLSLCNFLSSFFHMVSHALFKSLLFLCCGLLITMSVGSQDMRFKGNKLMIGSAIIIMLMVANLSLCGFPFLSGFFSKDLIVELSLHSSVGMSIFLLTFFSCMFSVVYSLKLVKLSILNVNLGFLSGASMVSFSISLLLSFLFFWSVGLGKAYCLIFLDGEAYMTSSLMKMVGITFFIGIPLCLTVSFSRLWSLFFEMLFFNWVSTSVISSSQIMLNFHISWESYWYELLGPKGVPSMVHNIGNSFKDLGFNALKLSVSLFFSLMLFMYWF